MLAQQKARTQQEVQWLDEIEDLTKLTQDLQLQAEEKDLNLKTQQNNIEHLEEVMFDKDSKHS